MIELWCNKCNRLMVEHDAIGNELHEFVCINCEAHVKIVNKIEDLKSAQELCNSDGCKIIELD